MTARSVSTNLLLLWSSVCTVAPLQLSLLLVDSYPLQHRSNYTTCMTIDSFSVDPFASHLASVWEVKLPVGTSGIRGKMSLGEVVVVAGRTKVRRPRWQEVEVLSFYFFVLSMPPFAFLHFLSFISRCPLIWFPQGGTATPCRDVGSPWNLFNFTFNNFFLVAIPSVCEWANWECRRTVGSDKGEFLWVACEFVLLEWQMTRYSLQNGFFSPFP